jgi:hypothetical protein
VGAITVTWAAPASDGGTPITSYDVVSDPGGPVCSVPAPGSCTAGGLDAGTSYTFAVIAVNDAGPSMPGLVGPVAPLAPPAPADPVVAPTTPAPQETPAPRATGDAPARPRAATPTPTGTPAVTPAASPSAPEVAPTPAGPASAVLSLALEVGEPAAGTAVELTGSGFVPGEPVTLTMHSDPVVLGSAPVGDDGTVRASYVLPDVIEPGTHRLIVDGRASDGSVLTETWWFEVDAAGVTEHVTSGPSDRAPAWTRPTTTTVQPAALVTVGDFAFTPYDVADHPKAALDTGVSAMTLIAVVGLGGLASRQQSWQPDAAAAGAAGAEEGRRKKGGGLAGAKAKHLKFRHEAKSRGDSSRTWVTPFVDVVDDLSLRLPEALNRWSPLAARVVNDGGYLRAVIGSLWVFLPLIGVALGVLAVVDTGGAALPPGTLLVAAIVVLGIVDVASGFAAASTFSLGVLLAGGLASAGDLRTLLAVDVVLFTVTLTASAMRPLRRAPEAAPTYWFDRGADFVVATLIGMWALTKTVGALPALSGLTLPISDDADRLALAAGAALVVRWFLETLAAHAYPGRLAAVQPPSIGRPAPRQQLAATAFNTVLFVFFAQAYLGDVWQLWAGTALFVVPSVLGVFQGKLPNLPRLVRWLPGGVIKVVVMFFVGKWAAMLLAGALDDPARMIPMGFVLLGLPGLVLSLLGFFGRDGATWTPSWWTRIGGIGVVVLGVLLVQGVVVLA